MASRSPGDIEEHLPRVIDSALGLDPQDMSEAAKQKRILRGLADLNHITFVAKIRVEASEDPRYGDQNRLDRVVLPTEKEWKLVMDGKDVPASPSRSRAAVKAAGAQPAWTQNAGQGAQPGASQARPPQTSGAPAWSPTSSGAAAPAAKPAGPAWLNG